MKVKSGWEKENRKECSYRRSCVISKCVWIWLLYCDEMTFMVVVIGPYDYLDMWFSWNDRTLWENVSFCMLQEYFKNNLPLYSKMRHKINLFIPSVCLQFPHKRNNSNLFIGLLWGWNNICKSAWNSAWHSKVLSQCELWFLYALGIFCR